MAAVHAAIKRGSFDYRAHFPRGSRLSVFHPEDYCHEGHTIRLGEYLNRWHLRRSPILPDGTVVRDADLHPSTWIHDASTVRRLAKSLGHFRLAEITSARRNQRAKIGRVGTLRLFLVRNREGDLHGNRILTPILTLP